MKFVLFVLAIPILISTGNDPLTHSDQSTESIMVEEISTAIPPSKSCNYFSTKLMAGQNLKVGEISITVDRAEYFIVTYTITEPGYCLKETHLSVVNQYADFPVNQSGSPVVGDFEYSENHTCSDEVSYTIPMAKGYVIAAHAVVKGQSSSSETAWAEGCNFAGDNWAMYFNAANLIPG